MLYQHILVVLFAVATIIFSPSFQLQALSSEPRVSWIQVADADTTGVAINPDGNLIVYSNIATGTIDLINWRTSETLWKIEGVTESAQWRPDGNVIALLGRDINLIDPSNGQHLAQAEKTLIDTERAIRFVSGAEELGYSDLHWSPDSRKLAALAYGYIVIYDFSIQSISTAIDVLVLGADRSFVSRFDWSDDGSTFAAFHYRLEEDQITFPPEIVLGFWDQTGRWLSQYEHSTSQSRLPCLPLGNEIFQAVGQIGSDIAWAPDNLTVAVSAGIVTVCSIEANGTLDTQEVLIDPPTVAQLQWSEDQSWLMGVRYNCTLLFADTTRNYQSYIRSLDVDSSFECDIRSTSWSLDGRYVALATNSGLWLGIVELP